MIMLLGLGALFTLATPEARADGMKDVCATQAGIITVTGADGDGQSFTGTNAAHFYMMTRLMTDSGVAPTVTFETPATYFGCLAQNVDTWERSRVSLLSILALNGDTVQTVYPLEAPGVLEVRFKDTESCDTWAAYVARDPYWDLEPVLMWDLDSTAYAWSGPMGPEPSEYLGESVVGWLKDIFGKGSASVMCETVECDTACIWGIPSSSDLVNITAVDDPAAFGTEDRWIHYSGMKSEDSCGCEEIGDPGCIDA